MPPTLPTGSVVAYGGPLPATAAASAGWLPCDGTPYATTQQHNLNSVISTNFGGEGTNTFNVPDLRGLFPRGTSHGVSRDPDKAERRPSDTGALAGDNVGSAQGTATGTPQNRFTLASGGDHSHDVQFQPHEYHNAALGASGPAAYNCTKWYADDSETSDTAGAHSHAIVGGDHETRPANIYVNWLIASVDMTDDVPPIGSIVPFGGDMTDNDVRTGVVTDGWYLCDGSALKKSITHNEALFKAIGTTYGGDSLKFNLPDLRGAFVIGAGGQRAIGSSQPATTAAANTAFTTDTSQSHTHNVPNPRADTHVIDVVMGVQLCEDNPNWSQTSTNGAHTHTLSDGDNESRPPNLYVDFIIRYA